MNLRRLDVLAYMASWTARAICWHPHSDATRSQDIEAFVRPKDGCAQSLVEKQMLRVESSWSNLGHCLEQ